MSPPMCRERCAVIMPSSVVSWPVIGPPWTMPPGTWPAGFLGRGAAARARINTACDSADGRPLWCMMTPARSSRSCPPFSAGSRAIVPPMRRVRSIARRGTSSSSMPGRSKAACGRPSAPWTSSAAGSFPRREGRTKSSWRATSRASGTSCQDSPETSAGIRRK